MRVGGGFLCDAALVGYADASDLSGCKTEADRFEGVLVDQCAAVEEAFGVFDRGCFSGFGVNEVFCVGFVDVLCYVFVEHGGWIGCPVGYF